MTISGFVAYVKQAWKNKPDTSTPLSAARLTHLEDGIKGNSDAIEKITAAVVSQIVNDPNKIASMAALYNVNQAVAQLNSDLAQLKTKTGIINPEGNSFDILIPGITEEWFPLVQLMDMPKGTAPLKYTVPVHGTLRITLSESINFNIRYIVWYKQK